MFGDLSPGHGEVTLLVDCMAYCAWSPGFAALAFNKLTVCLQSQHLRGRQDKEVQSNPQLHSEFNSSLGYMRPCLGKKSLAVSTDFTL